VAQEVKQTAVQTRSVQTRPTTDFRALPELGRPGRDKDGKAGSTDIQFFEEVSTGVRWVGKCGKEAMFTSQALRALHQQYEERYRRARYFDEYREAIGLALYQSLGIITPEVAVSPQLPAALPPRRCDLHLVDQFPIPRFKNDRHCYIYLGKAFPGNEKLFYRDGQGRDNVVPVDDWEKFEEEHLKIMQGAKKKYLQTDERASLITANGGHIPARDDELEGYEYHKPCVHLMTKFVIGFHVLGKPFITAYQQNEDKTKLTTVTTSTGEVLVLKGLGAALAMGLLLARCRLLRRWWSKYGLYRSNRCSRSKICAAG